MQYKGWSKEETEMCTIHSLTSGINKRLVCSVSAQTTMHSETDITLANISCVYDAKSLCNWLTAAVNITITYWNDIDQLEERCKMSGVISNK